VNQVTGGRWLSEFLFIHHLQRYTAGAGHRQPLYYYLTTLPVDLLPWTILVIPALLAYRSYRRIWREPILLFCVLWFFTVFLFFSASDTKRELYLLPLLPVVALLIGNYLNDLSVGATREGPLYRWLASSNFALVAVLGAALPVAAWVMRREALLIFVPGSLVLAAGGAAAVYFVRRGAPMRLIAAVVLMMTLLLFTSALWVFPYLEQFKSRRSFTVAIKQMVAERTPLYIYMDGMHDFNFYLGREAVPVLESLADIEKLAGSGQKSYVLIKERDFQRLKKIPPQWIVRSDSLSSSKWQLVELKADRPV
jgi:4-amino-4-deoxy-L-arabinose transferase-like glycosyltransferase